MRKRNGKELPAPSGPFADAERNFKVGYEPALWDVVWSCEVMGVSKPPWARDALIAFAHKRVIDARRPGKGSTKRFAINTRNELRDYEVSELVNLFTEGGEWCGRFSMPHPRPKAVNMVAQELDIDPCEINRVCARAKRRWKTARPYFSFILQQHRYD